jgi:hypothetical protein
MNAVVTLALAIVFHSYGMTPSEAVNTVQERPEARRASRTGAPS